MRRMKEDAREKMKQTQNTWFTGLNRTACGRQTKAIEKDAEKNGDFHLC